MNSILNFIIYTFGVFIGTCLGNFIMWKIGFNNTFPHTHKPHEDKTEGDESITPRIH